MHVPHIVLQKKGHYLLTELVSVNSQGRLNSYFNLFYAGELPTTRLQCERTHQLTSHTFCLVYDKKQTL